jgi:threonine dehydrogenase-like Zn-dependent dehydrogenase
MTSMTTSKCAGNDSTTRALWYAEPGVVEIRKEPLPAPRADEVLVRTLFSGVSRGTERLVLAGAIGRSEWDRMRAPLQAGDFPYPVKYGYCGVGVVEQGLPELANRLVFVLHPHQERFVIPANVAVPVPDGVPARRATLAAIMETALNGIWDSGAGPADRIVVVGGGSLGLLVGYLASRLPGAAVNLIDVEAERAAIAHALGISFAPPDKAPEEADVVFHTSATAAGLATAIRCAGFEATIVELSWYGAGTVAADLGGAFHSHRLRLVSSQVGQVAPSRRPRWSRRRRLEAALSLLRDPMLDKLITNEIAFDEAPLELPQLLRRGAPGVAAVIRYATP